MYIYVATKLVLLATGTQHIGAVYHIRKGPERMIRDIQRFNYLPSKPLYANAHSFNFQPSSTLLFPSRSTFVLDNSTEQTHFYIFIFNIKIIFPPISTNVFV